MTKLELQLSTLLTPEIHKLGYVLLDLEYSTGGGSNVLRLFIEHPEGENTKKVSLDDCTAVDQGLDPLMESEAFTSVLASPFTLEVSSPGIDRPLKNAADFTRYAGQKAAVKTYRPLTEQEIGNPIYFAHHQKQKNFSGLLLGFNNDRVWLETDQQKFSIPMELIAKAHLDIADDLVAGADKKQKQG